MGDISFCLYGQSFDVIVSFSFISYLALPNEVINNILLQLSPAFLLINVYICCKADDEVGKGTRHIDQHSFRPRRHYKIFSSNVCRQSFEPS